MLNWLPVDEDSVSSANRRPWGSAMTPNTDLGSVLLW
jgi:hypothetical protein